MRLVFKRGSLLTFHFRIIEHGLLLSLRSGLSADRSVSSVDGEGVSSVNVVWDLSAIDLPDGRNTCCGRKLTVYQNVMVQRTLVNSAGEVVEPPKSKVFVRKFRMKIPCVSCEEPRTLSPMTATQECPVCS